MISQLGSGIIGIATSIFGLALNAFWKRAIYIHIYIYIYAHIIFVSIGTVLLGYQLIGTYKLLGRRASSDDGVSS